LELELDIAGRAVEAALAAGATDAEATVHVSERFSTEARGREIAKLEQSIGRALTLRVFKNGAKATLATTDLSDAVLGALAREVVDAAGHVAIDPFAGLPDDLSPAVDGADLGILAADVRERAVEAKLDDALDLERRIREVDPRIANSSGSRVADGTTTVALVNSRGFRGSFRASSASRSTAPIAQDGANLRVAGYGSAARGYAALESVASIAETAARRAVDLCGARRPVTMRVPVIFERDVAAAVLSDVFASVNAAHVAIGNSFLIDRVGERIGSDLVTIVDDGRLVGGLGTSPFDAEGVPTRRTVVFDRGVLRTYLFDVYYGRKLGAKSTANASGGGVGPNNFYLEAGSQTLAALIAGTARGVFVVDTIGFATEYVSGTYSRGARGFAIENGELAGPLDEFTIAGNLATMLGAIDGVANDLRFDGAIVAPSFRVAEMTVSGQ
jgi:PmbA protein